MLSVLLAAATGSRAASHLSLVQDENWDRDYTPAISGYYVRRVILGVAQPRADFKFYRYRYDRQEWQSIMDSTLNVATDGRVHIIRQEYAAMNWLYVWVLAYRIVDDRLELLTYGAAGTELYRPNASRIGCRPPGEFGEPINTITGHMVRDEKDLLVPTPGLGLIFKRSYNSGFDLPAGALGPKWNHNFEWWMWRTNHVIAAANMSITNDCLKIRTGGGQVFTMNRVGTGDYWDCRGDNGWSAGATDDGGYELSMPGQVKCLFSSNGVLTDMADAWQNRLTLSYSDNGSTTLLDRVTHSNGQYLQFVYDTDRLIRVDTPAELSVSFAYNEDRVLTNAVRTSSRGPDNTSYAYSPGIPHALTDVTDPRGDVLHYAYDSDSLRCTSVVMNADSYCGYVITSATPNTVRTIAVRRGTNIVQDYTYDPYTLRIGAISKPNSTNALTRYYKDCEDNIYFEKSESAEDSQFYTQTQRAFDRRHNVTQESFGYGAAPGATWQYTWDAACRRLASVTDPESHKTTFHYKNGSLSQVRHYYSSGNYYTAQFGFAPDGTLTGVTNANGNYVTYHCDQYGFLTSAVPQLGPVVQYERDRLGNTTAITLPGQAAPRTTYFDVDELGKLHGIAYPAGEKERFLYDPGGDLVDHTDALGRKTYFERTDGGHLQAIARVSGTSSNVVRFSHDEWFNTLEIMGPDNRVVESYELDVEDRRTRIRNIEGQTMSLRYTVDQWVDSIARFDGSVISNAYDSIGRPQSITYPDDTIYFGYLRNGLLATASHGAGGITNTYNFANRLVSSKGPVPDSEVAYAYRPAGQVATITSVPGTHSYTYDAAARITAIGGPEGEFQYDYDPCHGLVSTVRCAVTGIEAEQRYDLRDRLVRLTYRNGAGDVLRDFMYSHDAAGQITNVVRESGEKIAYAYDYCGRLAAEKRFDGAGTCVSDESFSYDPTGNRARKTHGDMDLQYLYPYGTGGNRLASWSRSAGRRTVCAAVTQFSASDDGGARYAELLAGPGPRATIFMIGGRRQTKGKGSGGVRMPGPDGTMVAVPDCIFSELSGVAYKHNAAGCVTNLSYTGAGYSRSVDLTWNGKYQLGAVAVDGANVERNGYDAFGRRAWVSRGPTTNHMVYAGSHVIAEVDAAGVLQRSYTYGPGIDNILAMTVYTASETNAYYFLTDHQGSVHAVTDGDGVVVEQYRYDAWGNVTVFDADGTPMMESAIGNRYLWQGREYSWATGLYYFRARWYDPVTARWLSKDPIGIAGGLNQYVFCGNDPVNCVDPWGTYTLRERMWRAVVAGSRGSLAFYDGVLPFWNPLERLYADRCRRVQPRYKASRFIGGVTRDLEIAIIGFHGGGAMGTLTRAEGVSTTVGERIVLAEFGPSWGSLLTSSQPLSQGALLTDYAIKTGLRVHTAAQGLALLDELERE